MASVKRYLFGDPPFRFLAGHLAQDKEFIDDARSILNLDQDQYLRLATQLGKSDTFVNRSVLEAMASESLGDTAAAKNVSAIIYKVAGMLHVADLPVDQAMDALASAIQSKAKDLKVDERRTLSERIRLLAAEPVSLARQFKAQKLAGSVGAELDEFQFICDIRPIFDKDRERIEGAIPIAILQFEYSNPDGESNLAEFRVTAKQLQAMEEKISDMKRKLKVINDSLANQRIPIPITESTGRS
jgi:hypothetical protein